MNRMNIGLYQRPLSTPVGAWKDRTTAATTTESAAPSAELCWTIDHADNGTGSNIRALAVRLACIHIASSRLSVRSYTHTINTRKGKGTKRPMSAHRSIRPRRDRLHKCGRRAIWRISIKQVRRSIYPPRHVAAGRRALPCGRFNQFWKLPLETHHG